MIHYKINKYDYGDTKSLLKAISYIVGKHSIVSAMSGKQPACIIVFVYDEDGHVQTLDQTFISFESAHLFCLHQLIFELKRRKLLEPHNL